MCGAEGDGSSAFQKASSVPTEGQGGIRGSAEGLSEGNPRRGPRRYCFSKWMKKSCRVLGFTAGGFFSLPACIYLGSRGNTKSRCCRFAGGLLGGPAGLSLCSRPRAGKTAWEKKRKHPSLPFPLSPPDQFSDVVHHQSANRLYWLVVGALGEQNQPSRLGWQGGCRPKREHPPPHLNKSV